MDKIQITNTTCDNYSHGPIIPIPARVIAEICKVSESYVKKLRRGDREDNSEMANKVINADSLLSGGIQVLVNEVIQINQQSTL